MTCHSWIIQIALMGYVWIFTDLANTYKAQCIKTLEECLEKNETYFVPDNFYGIITLPKHWEGIKSQSDTCMIFLQKNENRQKRFWKNWPQMRKTGTDWFLYLPKEVATKSLTVITLSGNCNSNASPVCVETKMFFGECCNDSDQGTDEKCYQETSVNLKTACDSKEFNAEICNNDVYQDKYQLHMTTETCVNCDNPMKQPDEKIPEGALNLADRFEEGKTDASDAAKLMTEMGYLVSIMNGTSASLSVGGAEGVLVRELEKSKVDKVFLAYKSPSESMQLEIENSEFKLKILENEDILAGFSRSVTVSKEAFEKSNSTIPYVAVLRFMNMTLDEYNSTILNNEVLAIEMGSEIMNLTDKIEVNFKNIKYEGKATCHSWNGEGNKPNWTDEGCETKRDDKNVTCQCSHLTFFAILLTPLNETISSSDLSKLTIITQTGCGLSMFFLSVVLFMHFLIRKTKASQGTKIFIHLVSAMFLLNFTFLINNYVAKMKNSVGCKIMAALMHYFMLATFSWFAVQGFHLCLQLHSKGRIVMQNYIFKVSVTSWILPSIVGITLLALGKYGEQTIYTDNPKDNVAMCWITDSDAHYIVNIGYYMLVFLFTFTTFIITLSWLFCLKRSNAASKQTNQNGGSIAVILGLCFMLGITWGFAFFAYGSFRIPAYYIFTILNSFQGFFLFIYYYKTSHLGEINTGATSKTDSQSITTLKTSLETFENPYPSPQRQK